MSGGTLKTERLLLRPFTPQDAPAVQAIADDWDVARMTARLPHPYPLSAARRWIAAHESGRRSGEKHVFAITVDGLVAGSITIARSEDIEDAYSLGYWLGRDFWGQGYATEATRAMVRFAFECAGVSCLEAGHRAENPASGTILLKCGFQEYGPMEAYSIANGKVVGGTRYLLTRADWMARA